MKPELPLEVPLCAGRIGGYLIEMLDDKLGKVLQPSGKLDFKLSYRCSEGIPLTFTLWHR
jgi:hypothetical protein